MNKRALKIVSWNLCNGLLNKVDYVKNILLEHNVDIILLQETELPNDTDMNLINIQGSQIEKCNASENATHFLLLLSL